ncbi:hypothetical protein [Phaeocystidibacter marisrubri]|uniref:Uncharacterized protein n=1 Tax=Phaeocystidibacter marisrubri TaxID=1577780 RepID=A0A6L3ZEM7_9FLAO|nr:hypothetical protein [Phaeocystidibacter marisrubri]KAB2815907.1 hypothetical protein F8C82_09425 [Phaeocystidibacter marisrubri]
MFSLTLKKRPHFIPLISFTAFFLFISYLIWSYGVPEDLELIEFELKIIGLGLIGDLTFNYLFVLGLRNKLKFLIVLMRILLTLYGLGLLWFAYSFTTDVLLETLDNPYRSVREIIEVLTFLIILLVHGFSEIWLISRRPHHIHMNRIEEDSDMEVIDNPW